MSHDHVGVPKFIENGFSNDGKVYCYNLKVDKSYYDSINKLGTKTIIMKMMLKRNYWHKE